MAYKNVVIIGGGITGLRAAWELSKSPDYRITVIESEEKVGGMSTYDRIGEYFCDRYYHVIVSRDSETIKLVTDLGLEEELVWKTTKSGFFGEGRLVSLSGALDFLTFPFLTPVQKLRLGLGIFFTSKIKNGSTLEKQYVRSWMTKMFGRRVYERIWDPLLRSKLGSGKEETSAAFMWATIRRLYGARSDSASKQEKMVHVAGGYHRILKEWEEQLISRGVEIRTAETAQSVQPEDHLVKTDAGQHSYDKLLLTTPSPVILTLLGSALPGGEYKSFLKGQKYLGVVCLRLLLKRSLSPYYVINLLDETLPFTGIIESTNVLGQAQFGNNHLVYLPHYSIEEEDFLSIDEKKITQEYLASLRKVFPELGDEDILAHSLSAERHIQPLYTLDYGNRIPSCATPIPNVFMANTSMIKNATLNNNAAMELALRAVVEITGGE
jgi:protoporphyrinogen oxidase